MVEVTAGTALVSVFSEVMNYAGTSVPSYMTDLMQAVFSVDTDTRLVQSVDHTVGARLPKVYRAQYKPRCCGTDVRKKGWY
jgi:hypothetical protein